MTTKSPSDRILPKHSIPHELDTYLRTATKDGLGSSPTGYLERGAQLVTPSALRALLELLPELRKKTSAIMDSARLRRRLETLITYLEETAEVEFADAETRREIGFVLIYFLKGYDLIPDTIPHIGLMDDALLVEAVLGRHQESIRSHWLTMHRSEPEIQ
jgi:uncharacterized membrane protein YkvA (DUF1232 family)